MTQKKIHIVWQDGRTIDIRLEDNPVAEYYYRCIKHLQHIDLEFDPRKNPLHLKQMKQHEVVDQLLSYSKKVDLQIDLTKIVDQKYLNELHAIYFNSVNTTTFDLAWLKVHNCIHLLEDFNKNSARNTIWFDYEEKAGPLIKPFDRSFLKYATHERTTGMAFICGHELGKPPDMYWQHGEPTDLDVLFSFCKPWLSLKPALSISLESRNAEKENFNKEDFDKWFEPVRDAWCNHWNIPDWTTEDLFVGLPIGYVEDLPMLIDCFTKLDYPQRLSL